MKPYMDMLHACVTHMAPAWLPCAPATSLASAMCCQAVPPPVLLCMACDSGCHADTSASMGTGAYFLAHGCRGQLQGVSTPTMGLGALVERRDTS